jgi:hypothetical protein
MTIEINTKNKFVPHIRETPEIVVNGVFIRAITPMHEISVNGEKHLDALLLIIDKSYYGTMINLPETGWVVMKKYANSKQWREIGFPRRVPAQRIIELVESAFYPSTTGSADEHRSNKAHVPS